jgi:hypothetical protein
MEPAHFAITIPDDPELVERLSAAIARQSEPRITLGRSRTAVLTFECETPAMMLRGRVIYALEQAFGQDWPSVVQALD